MVAESKISPSILESQKTLSGVQIERFLWLHAGCGVELKGEVVNSSEIDPATGDLKPLIRTFYFCDLHNVRSASEETLGV